MMDLLVKDLDKELTQGETEEKAAQADYSKAMADAAEKRAADLKSLNHKESHKADLETELVDSESSHAATSKEHMANEKYIVNLHAECDFLMKFFDVRRQSRSDEIDSLGRAKAVLSGADYT